MALHLRAGDWGGQIAGWTGRDGDWVCYRSNVLRSVLGKERVISLRFRCLWLIETCALISKESLPTQSSENTKAMALKGK